MNDPSNTSRAISGKYAIVAVAFVAFAGSGYAWLYLRGLQHAPLEFWTPNAAKAILNAKRVEALRLGPVDGEGLGEVLELPGGRRRVVAVVDASSARGLIHIRHALIHRETFMDFDVAPAEPVAWEFALRFVTLGEIAEQVIVVFDCQRGQASMPGRSTVARVKPTRARSVDDPPRDPFNDFLSEQFAERRDP